MSVREIAELSYLDMQGYHLSQEAKKLRKEQLQEDQVVVSQSEFLNFNSEQLGDRVSIYLAGAITGLKDPDDNYRVQLIPKLKQIFKKCVIIDPLYDASWIKGVGYISETVNDIIVTNSFRSAARSDIVIAQILSNTNSPGTWFEMFTALLNGPKGHQLYVVTDLSPNIFLNWYQNNWDDFYVFSSFEIYYPSDEGLLTHLRAKFQDLPEPIDDPLPDGVNKSIWDFCNQRTYVDVVKENSYFDVLEIKAGHPQELIAKTLVRRMCYESKV